MNNPAAMELTKFNNADMIADLGAEMARNPNKVITIHEMLSMLDLAGDLRAVYEFADRYLDLTKTEVAKAVKQATIKNKLGYYPQNSVEFVQEYMKHSGFIVTFNGDIRHDLKTVRLHGEHVTDQDMQNKSVRETVEVLYGGAISTTSLISRLVNQVNIHGFGWTERAISHAFAEWLELRREQLLLGVYYTIAYNPRVKAAASDEWKKLVSHAFDDGKTSQAVATAVVQKFIWQVKRKIRKQRIENHLMLVLFGPQGTGKSTLARLICSPVADLMSDSDFMGVCDDKSLELFEYYVLFLDEMDKANRVDAGTIKRRITEPTITTRMHNTHGLGRQRNNATFIGTSNLPIDQVITDTTGTRRFYQLDVLTGAKQHWEVFNSINWLTLWQSVNEDGPDPTEPYKAELASVQEEERATSIVEEWAWWVTSEHPQQHNKRVTCRDLYYRDGEKEGPEEWCFAAYQNRYAPGAKLSEQWFGRELTRLCKYYGGKFPLAKGPRVTAGTTYNWVDVQKTM